MKAVLDHTQTEGPNIQTFWFKPEKSMRYTAGQYTELHLPHDNPDDRGIKRWFTLSSSPTDDLVSITTKFAGDTASTFKKALFSLPQGASVTLADPMGDFVLPKQKDRTIVFVAGGIGITPMHSMVKWLADKHEVRQIHLLYAVHSPKEAIFTDLLKKSPLTLQLHTGALQAEDVLAIPGVQEKALVYLSGPESLTEKLHHDLKERGVDERSLVTDYFPGYDQI